MICDEARNSHLESESQARGCTLHYWFSFVYKDRKDISKHDDLHERSTTWYSSAFGFFCYKGVRSLHKAMERSRNLIRL